MHLVDNLEFELDLASEARAFALQAPLQAFLRGPALRVIDEVFGAASHGGEVWRLDRLELDLGTVSGPDLPGQWEQRLREALQARLPALEAELRPAPQRLRVADSALAALLHQLHHGRLPWHGPALPPGGFGAWAAAVVQAQPQAVAAALRAPGAVLARERALRQWPAPALAALAGALAPALPLADWVTEGLQGLAGAERAAAERALWAAAVQALLRPGGTDLRALRASLRRAWRRPEPAAPPPQLAALAQALQTGQTVGLAPLWRAARRADPAGAAALLRTQLRRPRLRRLLALALPAPALLEGLRSIEPQALALAAPLLQRHAYRSAWRGWLGLQGQALERRLAQAALEAAVAAGDDPVPGRWLEALLQHLAGPAGPQALAAALHRAGPSDAAAAPLQAWLAERAGVDGVAAAWQRARAALAAGELPDPQHDLPLLLARDRPGLRAALRPLARDPHRLRRFAARAAAVPGEAWLRVLAGPDAGFAAALLRHAAPLGLAGEATRRLLFEALLAEPAGLPDRRRWWARFLRGVAAARGRPLPELHPVLAGSALPASLRQALRALVAPPPRPQPAPLERLLQPAGARASVSELAAWQATLDRREPSLAQRLRQALADARVALGLVRRLPELILRRLLQRLRPGQRAPAALPVEGWIALLQGRALPAPPPVPAVDESAPFAVDNAGLVLLAAYVPRWWTLLGLAVDGRFTGPAAAERAVLLLQWLVDGRTEADETTLALPRLLCGLPFARPLPCAIEPEPRELESGQQLLQAVIAHWGALGHTTVAGLRETFLQREGRLQRQGETWRLQVVPRAFDLLLDRLPWSWQTIRLSTMVRVLHVDWR